MIKFPKYKGCLTVEYIPVVFRYFALCFFVFLPEVPGGVYATVKIRILSPMNDIMSPEYKRIHSKSSEIEIVSKYKRNGMMNKGRKLLCLNSQFPVDSNSLFRDIARY